jgi:hypothetical protein
VVYKWLIPYRNSLQWNEMTIKAFIRLFCH